MPNAVPTAVLSMAGQSIWIDNITRAMLAGTLQKYIAEWSVVGLTSNPTIFAKAIAGSKDYDAQIAELSAKGLGEEEAFFELALADLTRACDLFAGVHARTGGVDGWCSLEVSPLLAYDAKSTVEQAVELIATARGLPGRARRKRNLHHGASIQPQRPLWTTVCCAPSARTDAGPSSLAAPSENRSLGHGSRRESRSRSPRSKVAIVRMSGSGSV